MRRQALRATSVFAGRLHGKGPLLVAIGDSHTDPRNRYTAPWNVWLRQIAKRGYRTFNLGFSGATTREMRARIERVLEHGLPAAVIIFGGVNDAVKCFTPEETAENVSYMMRWLRACGIERLIVVGTPHINWAQPADWWVASQRVRSVLRGVATEYGALFIDLGAKQQAMIENGEVPDFAIQPYRQRLSWHVYENNQHFNSKGHQLIADTIAQGLAFLRV